MENNKIELAVLEAGIEAQLEAIKEIIALLNNVGKAPNKEEAEKIVEETNWDEAIEKVQKANDNLSEIIGEEDLDDQGFEDEKVFELAVQLKFISDKIDEINMVLNMILG